AQYRQGRAHADGWRRDQIFLARDDLSLVPVPARPRSNVGKQKFKTQMSNFEGMTPRIRTEVQVMFFDTDCAAVVHNIAYLRFIEIARTLLAERLGMGLREMAQSGQYPVVVRTEIDYKRPAVLGDRLVIDGRLEIVDRLRFWC